MVKKDTTLEDFDSAVSGVDQFIHARDAKKMNEEMSSSKPVLFSCAIVISILLIVFTYFLLPDSKVKSVSVTGNSYLSKQYIEEISGITYDTRYFLVMPIRTANKIKSDPMIENCRIFLRNGNVAQIIVEEKQPVAYRFKDDGPYLLMSDGTEVLMQRAYTSISSKVPLVVGFENEEQTHLLVKALTSVSREMIEEIGEVRQYAMKYDDETLMIQMREGAYFFSSYFNLEAINHFHDIEYYSKNKNYCYYAESTQMVSGRDCPWNEVPTVYEYWLDDDGNPLINKYGDKAVKHYYKDNNGNLYLDDDGNKILIPINDKVEDIVDPNFVENYMKGYYKTGKLEIPEDEDEKDEEKDENTGQEEEIEEELEVEDTEEDEVSEEIQEEFSISGGGATFTTIGEVLEEVDE